MLNDNDNSKLNEFIQNNNSIVGKDGKLDYSQLPHDMQVKIQCTAGLSSGTNILLADGQLTNAEKVYMLYTNHDVDTFAIRRHSKIAFDSKIIGIPEKAYINELYDITFQHGFHIRCTGSTQFLVGEGFKMAQDITTNDYLSLIEFDISNSNGIIATPIHVESVEHKFLGIAEPVYTMLMMDGNILLPSVITEDKISFICVKQ